MQSTASSSSRNATKPPQSHIYIFLPVVEYVSKKGNSVCWTWLVAFVISCWDGTFCSQNWSLWILVHRLYELGINMNIFGKKCNSRYLEFEVNFHVASWNQCWSDLFVFTWLSNVFREQCPKRGDTLHVMHIKKTQNNQAMGTQCKDNRSIEV